MVTERFLDGTGKRNRLRRPIHLQVDGSFGKAARRNRIQILIAEYNRQNGVAGNNSLRSIFHHFDRCRNRLMLNGNLTRRSRIRINSGHSHRVGKLMIAQGFFRGSLNGVGSSTRIKYACKTCRKTGQFKTSHVVVIAIDNRINGIAGNNSLVRITTSEFKDGHALYTGARRNRARRRGYAGAR